MKPLHEFDGDAIARARAQGDTIPEIAQAHHASSEVIAAVLRYARNAPTDAQSRAARIERQGKHLRQLLTSGAALEEAAAAVEISTEQASRVLAQAGIEMQEAVRDAATMSARNADVLAQRAQGRSLQEIADVHGISRERVRQIVERWGGVDTDTLRRQSERSAALERLALQQRITEHLRSQTMASLADVAVALGVQPAAVLAAISDEDRGRLTRPVVSRVTVSDADILTAMQAVRDERAQQLGLADRPAEVLLTKPAWDAQRPDGMLRAQAIAKRFGSWERVCRQAGIAVHGDTAEGPRSFIPGTVPVFSTDDIDDAVCRFLTSGARRFGPDAYAAWTRRQASREPSISLIQGRFGWTAARARAYARLDAERRSEAGPRGISH